MEFHPGYPEPMAGRRIPVVARPDQGQSGYPAAIRPARGAIPMEQAGHPCVYGAGSGIPSTVININIYQRWATRARPGDIKYPPS